MVRFLHTSDWQLGMRRYYLDAGAQERFGQARIDAIRRIGVVAQQRGCSFIVVAGDVFESNHLDQRTIARAVDALRDVGLPVYLLPGNHDPHNAASIFKRPEFAGASLPNVQVLEQGAVFRPEPGVELLGAPWHSKRPASDLVADACAALEPAPNGTVRILVAHGAVSSFASGRASPSIIDEEAAGAAIADRRIHYLALGDRHSATRIGQSGRIWYSGAPEPTDFNETNAGKALVINLEPGRCSVEEAGIGEWRFVKQHVDLAGFDDVESLRLALGAIPEKERCILRLSFAGTVSIEAKARLDAALEDFRHAFAVVDVFEQANDLLVLPDSHDLESIQVGGYARDALERLLAQARDGNGAETARDAITLLHRLARGVA